MKYITTFNRLIFISLVLLGLSVTQASAALVTVGALSTETDGSSEIISDSLNNREWLRWDVLADLNYAQTVIATSAGGSHADYTIANAADAALFFSAAGSTNSACTTPGSGSPFCFFGNIQPPSIFGSNGGYSAAWFLADDNGTTNVVGEIAHTEHRGGGHNSGDLVVRWNARDILSSDRFASNGSRPDLPISWLLHKNVATVPVPAAVWLFGTALIGFVGMSRRRKVA